MICRRTISIPLVLLCAALLTPFANAKSAAKEQLLVSPAWLANALRQPSVAILQISRDRAAYDQGHIPGARLVLLNQIVVSRDGNDNELPSVEVLKEVFESAGVSNSSHVILYDEAQGMLATRAYFTLDYLGLAGKTSLLDGGLTAWTATRNPVTRDVPNVVRGKITPTVHPKIVVTYEQMRGLAQQGGNVVLVDARSPQVFTAKPGSSHLPSARNVYWMDTLESATNPVLKPANSVRAAYKNAGVKSGSHVIVYCNSGMQASHAYFTLKWLGYKDVMLYDGSFHEWTKHPDAPLE